MQLVTVHTSRLVIKPTKRRQINLGIHPVWSVFAVRMKKAWILSYLLSAHCWFCHEVARMWKLQKPVLRQWIQFWWYKLDRVKRIWYLSSMRGAKVQASLRIRAVSPEPPLLAHTSSESRGTFRQKARSLACLNGWACAVKTCRDGMLEDTNSLDGAQLTNAVTK